MNELIFFLHVLVNLAFLLIAIRYGKITLILFYVFQVILANFFVLKQISLFGFAVTASDVFAIGAFFSINLLREFYDKKLTYQTIWIGFMSMIGFMLLGQIHLLYAPNSFDYTHSAYSTLLSPTPRIAVASLITFLIVQRFDVMFFYRLKKKTEGKHLSIRMTVSLLISQLYDTILFSCLALYGIVESISSIVLVSYLIKVIVTMILTPFTHLCKKMVKQDAALQI